MALLVPKPQMPERRALAGYRVSTVIPSCPATSWLPLLGFPSHTLTSGVPSLADLFSITSLATHSNEEFIFPGFPFLFPVFPVLLVLSRGLFCFLVHSGRQIHCRAFQPILPILKNPINEPQAVPLDNAPIANENRLRAFFRGGSH